MKPAVLLLLATCVLAALLAAIAHGLSRPKLHASHQTGSKVASDGSRDSGSHAAAPRSHGGLGGGVAPGQPALDGTEPHPAAGLAADEAALLRDLTGLDATNLVPAAAKVLLDAIKTHDQINQFLADVTLPHYARSTLDNLQRLLFEDDYALASHWDPRLDCSLKRNASSALKNQRLGDARAAAEDLGAIAKSAAHRAAETPHPEAGNFYQRMAGSALEDQDNLLALLREASGKDPLRSELFGNALLFGALNTSLRAKQQATEQGSKSLLNMFESAGATAEALDRASGEISAQSELESLRRERLAQQYREIFGRRFQERHGISDPGLLEQLAAIDLPNLGLEISIQCPGEY